MFTSIINSLYNNFTQSIQQAKIRLNTKNYYKELQSPIFTSAKMDTIIRNPPLYKITQLDLMIDDISQRELAMNSFVIMWQQRVKLEYEYAQKLRSIYTNCQHIPQTSQQSFRPSEVLYSTFMNILSKQSSNHEQLAKQLNDQVYKQLKDEMHVLQSENRKNITLAKSLKKELQQQQQQVEKSKQRFSKKANDLQRLKLDYINATLLQDRDFQRKNKLFLKIKQLQSELTPIKKTYELATTKYSDVLSLSLWRFGEVCKKVQDKQLGSVTKMKRCLIDSQLFFSAFGAILVHETQTILSYLDSIETDPGTEILLRTTNVVDQERLSYQSLFTNPSEYLDETFRKIQNNSIEELIFYGKNPEYKRELSHYFEHSETEDFKNLKVINCYTLRIVEIFKSVFEGKEYSASSLIEFNELIKGKPTLRKDFIFCLQKYRLDGKFSITKENLNNIIELLNIFLDVCAAQLDTYNSKQFMVLSFTYYFFNQQREKIDLQFYVKAHKIWQNLKWWECGLIQSIYEEFKVKKRKSESITGPTFSLWDIKSSSLKRIDASSEESSTIQNICFNQLAYYLHNMQLFDLCINNVSALAQKYIKVFGLSQRMVNDIQTMCLNNGKQHSSPQRNEKQCS